MMALDLRDYQQAGVRKAVNQAKAGATNAVICSPVGSGKSVMMAELARIAKRPIVVSPSLTLLDQLHGNLERWLGEKVDVEQASRRAESIMGLRRRVIVASRHSLVRNERYKRRAYDGTSLVIVDECHIGITDPLIQVLRHFEQAGAFVVGFSATPYKGKGKKLPYWNRPCFSYSLLDAISDGWLVRPKVHLSEATAIDLSLVDEVAGDWHEAQLSAVLTAEHAVQEIASLVLETFRRKPSAVYCHCVSQAKLVAEVIARYGVKASIVYSDQKPEERKANMDAFMSGDSKIICNVGILSYGWDHPELMNIYNAAPTQSLSNYEQRIGRGTRTITDTLRSGMTKEERLEAIRMSRKPNFNVYDITDSSRSLQLVNALDVLDAKSTESTQRRERFMREMQETEGGVDILEQAEKHDAIDEQERLLAVKELKEKRQKLIVGMTFGHEDRDPFAPPEEGKKQRGWRMLWGQFKGQLIRDVPDTSYLRYFRDTIKKDSPFKRAISQELQNRSRPKEESRSA